MRFRVLTVLLVASGLVSGPARASQLVAPTIAARDSGLGGNVVAAPEDGPSVLLHNPAGVATLDRPQAAAGLFHIRMVGRYTNPATGYDGRSAERALAPSTWIGPLHAGGWSFGAGLYGAVGASFNFPADPSAGFPNRFLTELSTVHLGLVVGREIAPGLRLGLQAAPSFGRIRTRSPSPLGPVRFDIDGPGILGAVGLLYDLDSRTTLGVQYRSPGVVFMKGDGDVGSADDEVKIDFRIPQQVAFGVAYWLGPKARLLAQARWADYPQMEEGVFEFERARALDRPFIRDGRPVFRYGAGAEIAVAENVVLRLGFSREQWMIEEGSISPLLYDTSDFLYGGGLGATFGRWSLDLQAGSSFMEDRLASASANPVFPGRYQIESEVFGVTLSYRP